MANQKSNLNRTNKVTNNYSSIKLRDLSEKEFAESYPNLVNNKELT